MTLLKAGSHCSASVDCKKKNSLLFRMFSGSLSAALMTDSLWSGGKEERGERGGRREWKWERTRQQLISELGNEEINSVGVQWPHSTFPPEGNLSFITSNWPWNGNYSSQMFVFNRIKCHPMGTTLHEPAAVFSKQAFFISVIKCKCSTENWVRD